MINIQDITQFMRPGWIAMDKDGIWTWFEDKPTLSKKDKIWNVGDGVGEWCEVDVYVFKPIAPANDWTKSLIKVGGK